MSVERAQDSLWHIVGLQQMFAWSDYNKVNLGEWQQRPPEGEMNRCCRPKVKRGKGHLQG